MLGNDRIESDRSLGMGALVALAVLAGTPVSGAAQAPTTGAPPYHDQVAVTATELVLDLPETAAANRITISEGGTERRVGSVSPLAAGSWHVLVYVDIPISDHGTVITASESLAKAARELVALGEVRLVVADPRPVERLGPTRDSTALARALGKVASEPMGPHLVAAQRRELAIALRSRPDMGTTAPDAAAAREAALVRSQLRALLATTAEGCGHRPCALLLVGDGYDENPWRYYADALGEEPALEQDLSGATAALGPTLSALGWTVLALPMRPARAVDPPIYDRGSHERWQDAGRRRDEQLRLGRFGRRDLGWPQQLEALEVLLLPLTAPLRALARDSGGAVVRTPGQLERALARLGRRARISYTSDVEPASGDTPVAVDVTLTGARTQLWRAWALAGQPAAAVVARTDAILAGD
jgi:hypothetical protein